MPATLPHLKAEPLRINTSHTRVLMWWKFAKCGFRANWAPPSSIVLGIHKMRHLPYADTELCFGIRGFKCFPNWWALINWAPSVEAKMVCKHLPTILLCVPRPAGSQPTLCCKKSLLTPSIKTTLIFCLKQLTAWTEFMALITSGPARRRKPQPAQQLY